jgi:hypothetical protein
MVLMKRRDCVGNRLPRRAVRPRLPILNKLRQKGCGAGQITRFQRFSYSFSVVVVADCTELAFSPAFQEVRALMGVRASR